MSAIPTTPETEYPSLVIVAGPNGAGKTTTAPDLLRDTLAIDEFVNADTIAQCLSGFRPAAAAVAAGRIMLQQMNALAKRRASFAFETTLATRSFAPWIRKLGEGGYRCELVFLRCELVFLWLPSSEMAISRVQDRVRLGGHDVTEETIRRRYERGLRNFFLLYRPLASRWRMYDNSRLMQRSLIATGSGAAQLQVNDEAT